jgi:hypothetical protein
MTTWLPIVIPAKAGIHFDVAFASVQPRDSSDMKKQNGSRLSPG